MTLEQWECRTLLQCTSMQCLCSWTCESSCITLEVTMAICCRDVPLFFTIVILLACQLATGLRSSLYHLRHRVHQSTIGASRMNTLNPDEAVELSPLQVQLGPEGEARRSHFLVPYISVVVVATSAAGWSDRRERIRAQFPRNLRLIPDDESHSVILKFAVGRQGPSQLVISNVTLEAATFADILMLDCLDEDDGLNIQANWNLTAGVSATTSKVMLSVKWAVRHYDFDYFFRLGDDSYFRIDKFMSMISRQQIPSRSAVVGHILHDHVFGELQPYPQGMGYGLTYDVCMFIAANEEQLLNTAPEDCVVARWLMALGTRFIDSPHWRDIALGEGCQPDMVLAHKLPAELWPNITESGTIEC